MAEDTGLLGNNLLWQYLSNIGSAMQTGKSTAEAMNQVTQQNIGAQSKVKAQNAYLKQMAEALRASAPAKTGTSTGSGASMKMSPTGMTVNLPMERVLDNSDTAGLLGQLLGDSFQGGDIKPEQLQQPQILQGAPQPQQQTSPDMLQQTLSMLMRDPSGNLGMQQQLMGQLLNPQTSPLNISNADLAGLSSADMSQALHDVIGMEGLRQRGLGMALDANAQLFQMQQPGKIDKGGNPFPVPVYGMGQVDFDTWKALDNDTQAYSAYRYLQQQQNPNEHLVDFKEFKRLNKDDPLGYLRALYNDPELAAFKMKMDKNAAANISMDPGVRAEKTATGHQIGEMTGKLSRGDYWPKMTEEMSKTDEWDDFKAIKAIKTEKNVDTSTATRIHRNRLRIKRAENDVRAHYPDDEVERRVDGIYVNGKIKVRFPND